jgi:hypothetical protein
MVKVSLTFGLTLVAAVTVAVQGPVAGGVNVTDEPVPLDRVPQVEVTSLPVGRRKLALTRCPRESPCAPLPLMLQWRIAVPLASSAIEAERVTGASLAAVEAAVLSPPGSTIATASMVNATLADFELLVAEVEVMVAVQLAFSADSGGGV